MPQITFLPHPEYCPDGLVIYANAGDNLIQLALNNDIALPHECEMSCACTTCHVIIRQGLNSLEASDELEEDAISQAWGLEEASRLSCQVTVGEKDLSIEIPQYTLNQKFSD